MAQRSLDQRCYYSWQVCGGVTGDKSHRSSVQSQITANTADLAELRDTNHAAPVIAWTLSGPRPFSPVELPTSLERGNLDEILEIRLLRLEVPNQTKHA